MEADLKVLAVLVAIKTHPHDSIDDENLRAWLGASPETSEVADMVVGFWDLLDGLDQFIRTTEQAKALDKHRSIADS